VGVKVEEEIFFYTGIDEATTKKHFCSKIFIKKSTKN